MIASLFREAILLKASPNLHNAYVWRGMRVGLLGGSFNPPHEGHLHISRLALRMLRLDSIWWLVTPGNPLKDPYLYEPLQNRLNACRDIISNEPRMLATDIEDALGTHRTYDTLLALRRAFCGTDFVFLMGSDSAQNFHKWYRWQQIPGLAALGIIGRPPAENLGRNSPLKMQPLVHRGLSRAELAPLLPGTCYWMNNHPLQSQSSTEIRKSL